MLYMPDFPFLVVHLVVQFVNPRTEDMGVT
jgi:hypothetical protein